MVTLKGSKEEEFLDTGLDFKTVHYIEKRVKDGDYSGDVKDDLKKTGHSDERIEEHMQYVSRHRGGIPYHTLASRIVFIVGGSLLFAVIIVALLLFYY
jgi:hypothetical protein